MNEILNHIKINDSISTAGQPTKEQFETIKKEGFEVVINLALCDSSNALENEDRVVTNLGLTYIHIPVDFEEPKKSGLLLFLEIMRSFQNRKVFVHCAKNYRATIFMYVYHKYVLNTPFNEVDLSIFEQWTPSLKWQELMKINL